MLLFFHVALFLCCTFFILHHFHVALFCLVTFSCCTFFVLYSFYVLHYLSPPPPPPRLGLGFGLGLALELRLGDNLLGDNCPRTVADILIMLLRMNGLRKNILLLKKYSSWHYSFLNC